MKLAILGPNATMIDETAPKAKPIPAGPIKPCAIAFKALPVLPASFCKRWNDSNNGFKLFAIPINP